MSSAVPKINQQARAIQDRIVDSALEKIRAGEDVLIIAPTGSGKTYIGNRIAAQMNEERGDRTVMLQMRKRIAIQNDAKASHSGINPEKTAIVLNGEIGNAAQADVVYALPQTLADRPGSIGKRSIALVDEVHRAIAGADPERDDAKELNRVISDLTDTNPKLVMVGMTASPYPSEGNKLHPRMQAASQIVLTYQDAIDAEMITRVTTSAPNYALTGHRWLHAAIEERIDDRNIGKTTSGMQSLIRQGRKDNFMDYAVQILSKSGFHDKPTLGFADRIEEAQQLTDAMNRAGMKAGMIHSKMPQREIEKNIDDYEKGVITKLNSVDMIGEGFDAPNTEAILNIKALMTRTEYIQINGRAQRVFAGKESGHFIDLGASTAVYGTMDEFRKTQQFVQNNGTELKPWLTLTKEPYIRALVTGKDVFYAIAIKDPKDPKKSGYHVLRSYESRTDNSRKIEHVTPNVFNKKELNEFAKIQIGNNETNFMALRTRREMRKSASGEEREYSRASILASELFKMQKGSIMQMTHGKPMSLEQTKDYESGKNKLKTINNNPKREQMSI